MSGAHAALERAEKVEHVAHGGHGDHGGSSKLIGLTMGLIGVLVALCAALVGGERNEMSRAMIEQTQANADATSASTKFRVVMINIENMRAQPVEQIPASARERFLRLYDDYSQERQLTAQWAASYQPLVDARFHAAEGYEHAQLIAEIGIVFASLAVLLANRTMWLISVVLGVGSISFAGYTYVHTNHAVHAVEEKIEHFHGLYKDLRKAHVGDTSDIDAVNALDPGGVIRAKFAKEASAQPAKH